MAARHHTVPQMYLRNFAGKSDFVRIVDRDDPARSFNPAVNNAVAERGFYRIETEDLAREEDRVTHDPEAVEIALSQLEGAIAPILRKVIQNGAMLNTQDWYRLIQFAALQTARGRRWRQDITALATLAARRSILADLDDERVRKWLVAQGKPAGPDAVAEFVRSLQGSRFPRLIPPQAFLVKESMKMAFGDPNTGDLGIAGFLAGKATGLIRTPSTAVLTGDEPVCWWSPGNGPVGYATAQVVWLPLSPRLILQFRNPEFNMVASDLPSTPDDLAVFVNQLVAAQADRWIIHHPDDSPLAGIQLPPREIWADELIASQEEEDGRRRDLIVHRRLPKDE